MGSTDRVVNFKRSPIFGVCFYIWRKSENDPKFRKRSRRFQLTRKFCMPVHDDTLKQHYEFRPSPWVPSPHNHERWGWGVVNRMGRKFNFENHSDAMQSFSTLRQVVYERASSHFYCSVLDGLHFWRINISSPSFFGEKWNDSRTAKVRDKSE